MKYDVYKSKQLLVMNCTNIDKVLSKLSTSYPLNEILVESWEGEGLAAKLINVVSADKL